MSVYYLKANSSIAVIKRLTFSDEATHSDAVLKKNGHSSIL